MNHHLSERAYIPEVDSLRHIAAWLVVFYHVAESLAPGGLPVLMFFLVSGFVISHRLR